MGSDQISSFASFLEWGAIGLAGLMLVLVIFAIMAKDIDAARKSLLQTFMGVGALCFLAALAGEIFLKSTGNSGRHAVVLSVFPNDLSGSGFPAPEVKKDNQIINRADALIIDGKTTLTVDVSAAVGLFRATADNAAQAQAQVVETKQALAKASTKAEKAQQRVEETQKAVVALRQESEAKTAELKAAEETLSRQQAALQEVAERGNSLEESINALTAATRSASPRTATTRSRSAPVPSATVRRLQNDLQTIDRSLNGVGVFR